MRPFGRQSRLFDTPGDVRLPRVNLSDCGLVGEVRDGILVIVTFFCVGLGLLSPILTVCLLSASGGISELEIILILDGSVARRGVDGADGGAAGFGVPWLFGWGTSGGVDGGAGD